MARDYKFEIHEDGNPVEGYIHDDDQLEMVVDVTLLPIERRVTVLRTLLTLSTLMRQHDISSFEVTKVV